VDEQGRAIAGYSKSARHIVVNPLIHMDDILSTIVHEGQHAFDLARKIIPKGKAATLVDRTFAELRAWSAAAEFAHLNRLAASQSIQLFGEFPRELAITISRSYEKLQNISTSQMWEAIGRFMRESGR
jgi:hypothetical protein